MTTARFIKKETRAPADKRETKVRTYNTFAFSSEIDTFVLTLICVQLSSPAFSFLVRALVDKSMRMETITRLLRAMFTTALLFSVKVERKEDLGDF